MYGLLIFFAITLSLFVIEERIKKADLDIALFWKISFWTLIFGILGARIYHVMDFWEIYSRNIPSSLYFWHGGMGIFGGLFLGFITLYWFLNKNKQNVLLWLDKIVVPIPLAQAIGRWGNYFNNELLPYALYESFLDLILFFGLLILEKKKVKTGNIFLSYVAGYALIRLVLEPLKTYSWEYMGLNVAQSISILLILGTFIWHQKLKKHS